MAMTMLNFIKVIILSLFVKVKHPEEGVRERFLDIDGEIAKSRTKRTVNQKPITITVSHFARPYAVTWGVNRYLGRFAVKWDMDRNPHVTLFNNRRVSKIVRGY